jgi:hypothetical protein
MAKSKSTHARAPAAVSKRARRTKKAGATGSKQQRSGGESASTRKKERRGAPTAPDEATPRRTPSEYDPDIESGGGKEPRGGRSEETIDEETDARSKRPGGPGDVSFGEDDEGPEGPAR